jgi:NAD(P)H dehydrogenase (quinone)
MSTSEILVAYYSWKGLTEELAQAVAAGVDSVDGSRARVCSVDSVERDDLLRADGVILGSPTYLGSMAGPMKTFIDDWELRMGLHKRDVQMLRGKVVGAFATEGRKGGGQLVLLQLLQVMLRVGMVAVAEPGGLGPVGRNEDIDTMPEARAAGHALGKRVAELALRLRGSGA